LRRKHLGNYYIAFDESGARKFSQLPKMHASWQTLVELVAKRESEGSRLSARDLITTELD